MNTGATTQTAADALEERLIGLAVRIIPLANRLTTSFGGRHIASQLIWSGTAAAPNYAEARSAESRADFIHKLRIAVKELNETAVWLRIVARSELLRPTLLSGLHNECDELRRITGASIRTARLRASQ